MKIELINLHNLSFYSGKKKIRDEDQRVSDAVSIFEKTPFSGNTIDHILSCDVKMDLQFNNDIYSQYLCNFPEEINSVKNTLIYPANEKHLKKYSAQRSFMVAETPDVYQKITVPYLEEQQAHLQVKLLITLILNVRVTQENIIHF